MEDISYSGEREIKELTTIREAICLASQAYKRGMNNLERFVKEYSENSSANQDILIYLIKIKTYIANRNSKSSSERIFGGFSEDLEREIEEELAKNIRLKKR